MKRREFLGVAAAAPAAATLLLTDQPEPEGPLSREWLDHFQELVEEHQFDFPPSEELTEAFEHLARVLIRMFMHLDSDTEEEATYECVNIAFEKLGKYNGKAKAHNYFSTIMMCRLRQQYRRRHAKIV